MDGEKYAIENLEAIRCGASFITADMSNIDTWPNIYIKDENLSSL
jgi:hypothetical protein